MGSSRGREGWPQREGLSIHCSSFREPGPPREPTGAGGPDPPTEAQAAPRGGQPAGGRGGSHRARASRVGSRPGGVPRSRSPLLPSPPRPAPLPPRASRPGPRPHLRDARRFRSARSASPALPAPSSGPASSRQFRSLGAAAQGP